MLLHNIWQKPSRLKDVVWHFSGIRPLFNDGASEATEATRDYVITQDRQYDDTLINVFGGKITTYRKLAEEVLALVDQRTQNRSKRWTAGSALPGGDFAVLSFDTLVIEAQRHFAFADPCSYGGLPVYTALKFGRFSKTVSRSAIWALISGLGCIRLRWIT